VAVGAFGFGLSVLSAGFFALFELVEDFEAAGLEPFLLEFAEEVDPDFLVALVVGGFDELADATFFVSTVGFFTADLLSDGFDATCLELFAGAGFDFDAAIAACFLSASALSAFATSLSTVF